jgi:hypothetical protein
MQKAVESISSAQRAKVKAVPVTLWVIAILFGAAWMGVPLYFVG